MKTWRVALFDRAEANAFAAAQHSINVAFPIDGPDAVAEQDPRRSILRGLSSRNDTVTEDRLNSAKLVLQHLVTAHSDQSKRSYWIGHLGHEPRNHAERTMVATLIDARRIQLREALVALAIVESALCEIAGREQTFGDVFDNAHDDAKEIIEVVCASSDADRMERTA